MNGERRNNNSNTIDDIFVMHIFINFNLFNNVGVNKMFI